MLRIIVLSLFTVMLISCAGSGPKVESCSPQEPPPSVERVIIDTLKITDSIFVRETQS